MKAGYYWAKALLNIGAISKGEKVVVEVADSYISGEFVILTMGEQGSVESNYFHLIKKVEE